MTASIPPHSDAGARARHARIAIGIFIALFLLSLAAGYLVYRRLAESEEQKTEITLNNIADVRSAAVSVWMRERLNDTVVFSSDAFLGEAMHAWLARGAGDDRLKAQILAQLKTIKSAYRYLDVCIYDSTGRLLLSTESNEPYRLIIAEKQAAMLAFASGRIEVSSVQLAPAGLPAKRMVQVAAPLRGATAAPDRPPLALVMTANADVLLEAFIQSSPVLTNGSEVFLVEIRGDHAVVTASSDTSHHFDDLNILPISPEAFLSASGKTDGSFQLASRYGNAMISVVRRIDGVPWYLVTMLDRNATHANLERLAWLSAGIAAAMLSILGAAVLFWWRERESQFRLQSLQAATEKALLQRQYDYLSKYANDLVIRTDTDGTVLDANDKAMQILGRGRADLIGMPFSSAAQDSCDPPLAEAVECLRRNGTAMFEICPHAEDGQPLRVEISARAIEHEGRHLIQMIGRDVTERRQAEAALRGSQDRINAILASIQDVVWSLSPDLSHLHYINQSAERIYGYPASAFVENPVMLFDAIHPEDRARADASFSSLDAQHPLCDTEYRIVRRDREVRWLHCKGMLTLDDAGRALRIDGVFTDITERKNAEQQVQTLAYYDSVTMLPNRRLLQDRLAQAMHMAVRSTRKVALLYMDLDNFKYINDSLGHHIGDMLLREIGDRLLQCVREEDTVARIGGDEFLVVLPDIEKGAQAVAVAEKILAATARPFMLREHQIHTTISIGISIYPDDAQEPQQLMQHADSALYQAKGQGRDNYQFFTPELNRQIMRSSSIERQLREAMDGGELKLWYQPQIDIARGKLTGAEVLLRWRRKNGDQLSPVEFIPVAEERGLIGRIGEWALREACTQCRRWQLQGLAAVPVAVNVSPLQFQQKGFAGLVTGILAESGLDATYLELEITESAIMRRAPQVAQLARQLRDAGVGISIDDFGTGYSSLSYLKQIPIDKIKIDRSFITDMLHDDDSDAITYAIVNLAHSLNLRVIAEGVESKAQIDRLRLYSCDEVQGYYYSAALSATDFERMLAERKMFLEH